MNVKLKEHRAAGTRLEAKSHADEVLRIQHEDEEQLQELKNMLAYVSTHFLRPLGKLLPPLDYVGCMMQHQGGELTKAELARENKLFQLRKEKQVKKVQEEIGEWVRRDREEHPELYAETVSEEELQRRREEKPKVCASLLILLVLPCLLSDLHWVC